jgi:hypothetical protein
MNSALPTTNNTTALLAMTVTDRPEAEAFIFALCDLGLSHHFDDGAVDCLHGNGLVTKEEAETINALVEDCYAAWEASGADLKVDCPIGHVLKWHALDDFRRSGVDTADLGATLDDECLAGLGGRVYLGSLYIQSWTDDRNGIAPPNGPTWLLPIGNNEREGDLAALEVELFAFACEGGYCGASAVS